TDRQRMPSLLHVSLPVEIARELVARPCKTAETDVALAHRPRKRPSASGDRVVRDRGFETNRVRRFRLRKYEYAVFAAFLTGVLAQQRLNGIRHTLVQDVARATTLDLFE